MQAKVAFAASFFMTDVSMPGKVIEVPIFTDNHKTRWNNRRRSSPFWTVLVNVSGFVYAIWVGFELEDTVVNGGQ